MKHIRTRIAPSPTGEDLHIGNAYTALINYLLAKKFGGEFIVRIEDTDRTRLVPGSEERILASLAWLGIVPDEGPSIGGPFAPYRQSDRLASYKQYAQQLVSKGHAYHCFCSPDRLQQMRQDQEAKKLPPMYDGLCKNLPREMVAEKLKNNIPSVIRLHVPDDGETVFTDAIRGEIRFENKLIDDQVLLKTDGFPTYHLGVVVDDHLMEISHIIRGEEWISSTPKHILLYKYFGWEIPTIAHVSVLRNPDKSKLSKRKNPVWVSSYKNLGYLPEAMQNYLGMMAWSFPDGRDIFSFEEKKEVFDLAQIQTTAPIFDPVKLRWINGEYMKKFDDSQLISLILTQYPHLQSNEKKILEIIPLIRDRMKIVSEFDSLAGFFFQRPTTIEKNVAESTKKLLKETLGATTWNHDAMEQAIRDAALANQVTAKDLFMCLRLLITGKSVGPPLLESLVILGQEETLSRLS